MAILDFLGQDIGDNKYAEGPNQTGGAGVDTGIGKTGITWGQLLAGFGGGKGVSQSAPIGGLMQAQFPGAVKSPQTVPIMNINSQLPMQEEKQQGQSDWQSILKIIMAIYGGGTGVPIT